MQNPLDCLLDNYNIQSIGNSRHKLNNFYIKIRDTINEKNCLDICNKVLKRLKSHRMRSLWINTIVNLIKKKNYDFDTSKLISSQTNYLQIVNSLNKKRRKKRKGMSWNSK